MSHEATGGGPASRALFDRARAVIPGGVNSPVRAYRAVGGTPVFVERAAGARITDADGRTYLDYVMSYGPLPLGHAPPAVIEALTEAIAGGTAYGAPTRLEVELAELACSMVPALERLRMVNSGSEAVTSALRLARGATGRTRVMKCSGCFHGSVDSLLVAAGSGVATLAIPDTAGIPESVAAETVVIPYNDFQALEDAFRLHGDHLAAFILEPVAANMGLVPPAPGYLRLARELTARHGALLIFDEVITGFRLGPGGAAALFGIVPDLYCFGKILGGGVPAGGYGGARELMDRLAPVGPVYQAGTLSGNPLATTAGLATLRTLAAGGATFYAGLERLTCRLRAGLNKAFREAGVPVSVQMAGSLLTPFFAKGPVTDYATAKTSDTTAFARFFHAMLADGIHLPPSQFECWFLSAAHTPADIELTIAAARTAARAAAG